MNWKIRLKNPVFWVQIALGAFATALAYAGLTAADMTTWVGVWQIIKATAANPYCLFLIACNVWSALNDPTSRTMFRWRSNYLKVSFKYMKGECR